MVRYVLRGTIHANTMEDMINWMSNNRDVPILLEIDCPGGHSGRSLELAERIMKHGKVSALVTGECMSAAVTVLVACNYRMAVPTARFMTHSVRIPSPDLRPSMQKDQETLVEVLREMLTSLFYENEKLINHLMTQCGQSRETVEAILDDADTNFGVGLACTLGMVHRIVTLEECISPLLARIVRDEGSGGS